MQKIGIVGLGAIGGFLAQRISRMPQYAVVAVAEPDTEKVSQLRAALPMLPEPSAIAVVVEKADLIIEAAGGAVAPEVLEACIAAKKDCMILSSGGLLAHLDLLRRAKEAGIHMLIPSGALAGMDALRAAKLGRIDSVTLVSTKAPSGFADAPYVLKRKLDLSAIRTPTVLFEGDALAAVEGFPQNVNVAATLSLYGIGPQQTQIRIVADPAVQCNQHEVIIEGDFGVITTKTQNVPSPDNPKTSVLAALSALSLVHGRGTDSPFSGFSGR